MFAEDIRKLRLICYLFYQKIEDSNHSKPKSKLKGKLVDSNIAEPKSKYQRMVATYYPFLDSIFI